MIPTSHFLEDAPEELGAQVNICHTDCPAGEDRRSRLYIKRTLDNVVVAYCHNCGETGVHKDQTYRNVYGLLQKLRSDVKERPEQIRLPKDYDPNPRNWPNEARLWPLRYGIKEEELQRHRFGFSECLGRVLIPLYFDGELCAYQTRRIFKEDTLSKYLTKKRKDVKEPIFWVGDGPELVLCEDALSAIKVGRYKPAAAVLGSNPSNDLVTEICRDREKITVFFDNDNAKVKRDQLRIKKLCGLLCSGEIIYAEKDPKEHSDEELKYVLA